MAEADDQGMRPTEQLVGYLRIAARFSDAGKKVCPGGVLETELHALPVEMQAATRQMMAEIFAWLEHILEQGRKGSEFQFVGESKDMAALVQTSIQGAIQSARVLGPAPLEGVLRQLHIQLGMAPS
jgi:hypothetical protein